MTDKSTSLPGLASHCRAAVNRRDKLIMKKIKDLIIRLAIKVACKTIAFSYNPNQAEIIQLLWDIYSIVTS